jgi:Cu-Zn family superoxide dismutase
MLLGLALVAVVVVGSAASVLASSHELPDRYVLPGDEVYPEGVATLEGPDYFYVSSTTDGTIFRGQLREPEAEVFLPGGADGRTTATGLAVDSERGRLLVSGGASGMVFSYDLATRELIASGMAEGAGFINDVALGPDGSAYFTDSMTPVIYRLPADASGEVTPEVWLEFEGTVLEYQEGFNLNGIATTPSGAYLIAVQSNTGKLFRISIDGGEVVEIDLGGATVMAGDGLEVQGHLVTVVRNALGLLTTVRMSDDYSSGEVWTEFTDPSFMFPTTAAYLDGRLLVVNSQFSARESGNPSLPFTVSSIPTWKLTRSLW